MGLYARIASNGDFDQPVKISAHRLGAALREWAGGGVVRQQVIDAFNLDATEQAEIDAIAAAYTQLPTNTAGVLQRAQFLQRMEDVFLLVETGDYTEAKAKERLGF